MVLRIFTTITAIKLSFDNFRTEKPQISGLTNKFTLHNAKQYHCKPDIGSIKNYYLNFDRSKPDIGFSNNIIIDPNKKATTSA